LSAISFVDGVICTFGEGRRALADADVAGLSASGRFEFTYTAAHDLAFAALVDRRSMAIVHSVQLGVSVWGCCHPSV